jgi:protein-tyrosine-phosphatase
MRSNVRRLLENSKHSRDVPDPYHGEEKQFESMFEVIRDGCHALAEELFSSNSEPE